MELLSKFYGTAAKNTVLAQASSTRGSARGVADDMPDAGFEGAYKGAGGASGGILGMMQIIKSDFERTIKETHKQEKQDADEFKKLDTETQSSISSKTIEQQALDGQKIE